MQRLGIKSWVSNGTVKARIAAGRYDVLLPGDRLLVLGRPDQISGMAFSLASQR
jgi:hypothetical protein